MVHQRCTLQALVANRAVAAGGAAAGAVVRAVHYLALLLLAHFDDELADGSFQLKSVIHFERSLTSGIVAIAEDAIGRSSLVDLLDKQAVGGELVEMRVVG